MTMLRKDRGEGMAEEDEVARARYTSQNDRETQRASDVTRESPDLSLVLEAAQKGNVTKTGNRVEER